MRANSNGDTSISLHQNKGNVTSLDKWRENLGGAIRLILPSVCSEP